MNNIFKKLRRNDVVLFQERDNGNEFNILIVEIYGGYIEYEVENDNCWDKTWIIEDEFKDGSLIFLNKINAKRLCKNCLVKATCGQDDIFTCAKIYFERK